MHIHIKNLFKEKLGVDKSIAFSSGARIIQAITGFITLFFIARYLSGIEQGFYYTFGSIVAVQIFFELGLTSIITQFVAHEKAHLVWNKEGLLEPNLKYKSRLASLMRFCLKWYFVISLLLLLSLLVFGFAFFISYSNNNTIISWKIPWIILSIGTVVKLFQSPFNSFLMGLGKVEEMSKITFYQQCITPLCIWIGLLMEFKLYIVGISSLVNAGLWFFFVYKMKQHKILLDLAKTHVKEKVSYLKEIFPYQWKIAISWISGYFIFQLFNPVLFATEGAIVAGQMGMTLSILSGIQALSMNWINTKIPLYSNLIVVKDYNSLDYIFKKTLRQQIFVCLFLLSVMFVGLNILNITGFTLGDQRVVDRFLPTIPMLLMMISLLVNMPIFSWATYLRCHKKEPFLINSIVNGIACCLSTFILGKLYGLWGVTIGYCCITLLNLYWAKYIFKTCKFNWHGKE